MKKTKNKLWNMKVSDILNVIDSLGIGTERLLLVPKDWYKDWRK